MNRNGRRTFVALAVAGLVAASSYALTASNTVTAAKAGDGAGAISGYTVSNVKYITNGTNPQNIDTVTFTLDTAPGTGTTKIQLAPGGSWYSCTSGTPATNQSCATTAPTQATISAATELRVVTTQ